MHCSLQRTLTCAPESTRISREFSSWVYDEGIERGVGWPGAGGDEDFEEDVRTAGGDADVKSSSRCGFLISYSSRNATCRVICWVVMTTTKLIREGKDLLIMKYWLCSRFQVLSWRRCDCIVPWPFLVACGCLRWYWTYTTPIQQSESARRQLHT